MTDIVHEVYGDLGFRKPTKEMQVLALLQDGRWHSGRELAVKVSHRFGAYLFTLTERGAYWTKRLDPDRPKGEVWYQYRLTSYVGSDNQLHLVEVA